MARKLALGVILAVVVLVGSRPTANAPVLADVTTADEGGQSRLGYLEHRGSMYALEDLMDPNYRAASDDDFVRTFDPGAVWAGTGVRKSGVAFWPNGVRMSSPDLSYRGTNRSRSHTKCANRNLP